MESLSNAAIGGNEFFVQISNNLRYLKTYNYDLFKFYPANRAPEHWVKIKESIEKQDLTPAQPILVDKYGFIIDGQGRFTACRALKMPIYALVMLDTNELSGESYISILNSFQKNWSIDDFLSYYCQKGLPDYQRVKAIANETKFTISLILGLWQQSGGSKKSKSTTQTFREGNYRFCDQAIKRLRCVHSVYSAITANKPNKSTLPNKAGLCKAIVSILASGAKVGELKRQINKFGFLIEDCGTQKQYFEMLQHIFNYKKRAQNKVVFNPFVSLQKGNNVAKRGQINL